MFLLNNIRSAARPPGTKEQDILAIPMYTTVPTGVEADIPSLIGPNAGFSVCDPSKHYNAQCFITEHSLGVKIKL